MGQHLRDAVAAQDRAEPATSLSGPASRVVDKLRSRGVQTQPAAIEAIAAWEGAGLNPGQIAEVLWQFAARSPQQHLLIPEQDPEEDWDPQRCNDGEPVG